MDWMIDPQLWASLLTLTALEIVLGVDNLVFVAIIAGRLPAERQNRGRQVGLALALLSRLVLLASITWMIGLTRPLFDVVGHAVSWRDVILVAGGMFLLYKATTEIHHRLEEEPLPEATGSGPARFATVVVQIMLLDVVFSLDSVITAIGMSGELWVMATAIVVAVAAVVGHRRLPASAAAPVPTAGMGDGIGPAGGREEKPDRGRCHHRELSAFRQELAACIQHVTFLHRCTSLCHVDARNYAQRRRTVG